MMVPLVVLMVMVCMKFFTDWLVAAEAGAEGAEAVGAGAAAAAVWADEGEAVAVVELALLKSSGVCTCWV